jgi:metallo-beta-lactamase family protein
MGTGYWLLATGYWLLATERLFMRIRITFLGAARNVTGSRFLVEADGSRVLVDCGLYQERDFANRNWDPFPFPAGQIDAVLLTHAHLDHCGLLPKLVREGFRGKIHCTPPTAEIAQIVLLDSAHIQEEDAAYKLKRHRKERREGPRPVEPLYTTGDAERVQSHFEPVPYEKKVDVAKGVTATFHDAGHVFGSSMITVNVDRDGESRTILFSGDVGRKNQPILHTPTTFDRADYVLIESTYGDRVHEPEKDVPEALAEVIDQTDRAGGNLVIPCFALERSQNILYYLSDLLHRDRIPPMMVFLDSPMAIKITEVFGKYPELYDEKMRQRIAGALSPFKFPGLTMTRTVDESKAINRIKGTAAILAGSGMCTGGRIKHHLANNIERPESTILFVGYQAKGTLGRVISGGAREVRIHGVLRSVRARVARVNGMSAHADRQELFGWLSTLKKKPRGVFVVHGETESAESFAGLLREKDGWQVTVPKYRDTAVLD